MYAVLRYITISVSYTHLDVYKRQALNIDNVVPPETSEPRPIFIPLSNIFETGDIPDAKFILDSRCV